MMAHRQGATQVHGYHHLPSPVHRLLHAYGRVHERELFQQASLLGRKQRKHRICSMSAEPDTKSKAPPSTEQGDEIEIPESEAAQKKAEADRLRAAEKFMVVGTGEAVCAGCGYEYMPKNGDPEYPITPGTLFTDLPDDWNCPICGAEKQTFQSKAREIAGFAENQKYGLGTNSLTGGQKSLLIFGSLLLFFFLFLGGYFIE
ncbi:g7279 [Coccomyxa elongata]